MIKTCFRIGDYAVSSTPRSVIYFGGYDPLEVNPLVVKPNDRVVEYKNLKWTLLGFLASPRIRHRSIKMNNKIYIFGGNGK